MRNYEEYKYSVKEICFLLIKYSVILGLTAFFFYRSIIAFLIFLLSAPFYLRLKKKELIRTRKKKLALEFSQVLTCVNANVLAGLSVENAFVEAVKDIKLFYGEKSLMEEELHYIKKGLSVNKTLEEMLKELGERSRVEDIEVFAGVFELAKRNGGKITRVLSETADSLKEKQEVEKEIEVVITQKKLEFKIMEIIPFLIMGYIEMTSAGYFNDMYGNAKGILFMTLCLLIYLAAVFIGTRTVNINV